MKQDLVSTCLDFNLYDAFRMLDVGEKGHISIPDMLAAL